MKKQIFNLVFLSLMILAGLFFSGCDETQTKETPSKFAPKIGVCGPAKNVPLLKANGYDYVELNTKRFLVPNSSDDQFQKNFDVLKAHNFNAYACNSFVGGIRAVGEEADHDKMMEYAEVAFRRAKEAGIKRIVYGSGGSRRLKDGYSKDKAKEQFIAMFKRMGPIAAKYDVVVVIEPLNKGECNFINTVTEGTEIARSVNHPNIAVLADFYHMLREGEGPESIIEAGDLLKHCHIAENVDRAYPGKNKEDFTGYLAALKKINYKGAISVECRWSNLPEELPKALEYLQEQIEIVK